MSGTRVVTIICWGITALVLIGLALWFMIYSPFGISGGISGFGVPEKLTGSYELAGTIGVPVSGVDSMKIDWVSGDVTVGPYDGEDIQISEYARRELKEEERLTVNTADGTITIKFREKNKGWNMPSKKLEVLVPRVLCEGFNKFDAESTSGRLIISGLNTEIFVADTVSGGVELSGIKTRSLDAEATSGNIMINSTEADTITIESVSGIIELSGTGAGSIVTDSTSGDQRLYGAFDKVKMNTTSGTLVLVNDKEGSAVKTESTSGAHDLNGSFESADLSSVSGGIKLRSGIVPAELKTDTTSGDVTVTIPRGDGITVSHDSTSGELQNDIPVTLRRNGAQFRFSSTSGDVTLLALD